MQVYFLILYFFTYGFLGWCTEVAFASVKEGRFVNRGFLNGPICPIYGVGVSAVIFLLEPCQDWLPVLYIASVVLVTLIEGLTGYAMDKIFHHKWWDYSDQPLNIGGYVCLIFSLVWGVACVAIVKGIHPLIHKALAWIPVTIGIAGIVILGILLFADQYVTASGILKLNRRLEAMEKIAAELRELSDRVGENIHEGVMDTLEFQEEGRQKLEEITEEGKQRLEEITEGGKQRLEEITEEGKQRLEGLAEEGRQMREEQRKKAAELRKRYEELAASRTRVSVRLVKAFPNMKSRRHNDILEELKNALEDRVKHQRNEKH